MGALPVAKLSVEEYLALDRVAEVPSEYHDGEMFPMQTVSVQHAVISLNMGRVLAERLDRTPCVAAGASLRLRVSPTQFLLPYLVVFRERAELTDEHQDTLTNPKVIVEILSPSSKDYDYGTKFTLYRLLQSFEEYVLVAQDKVRVEVFRKTPDKRWLITTYDGLDAVVQVESLGISFPMAEVYARVDLPAAEN